MLDFNMIKSFYDKGLWNAQLVRMSVRKGILTEEQASEILEEREG